MAFKINQINVTETTFDLTALPIEQWPDEAKELAKELLSTKRIRTQLLEQLPDLRKDWLALKVEAYQQMLAEFNIIDL
jgi:hypothetical protein